MSVRCLAALLALAALLLPRNGLAAVPPIVVDDFENTAPWSAVPADGVLMKLSSDTGAKGKALRIDFDFAHGGGYAVARRDVDLTLPDRYAFVVRLRGEC
ncbi:MAG TPA: hypothetical protein VFQ05_02510, partial [Candidatus Eisenbacteria bacterium]|nr:hypothetical protein [Candidatus Eisenbacteria bacterium]